MTDKEIELLKEMLEACERERDELIAKLSKAYEDINLLEYELAEMTERYHDELLWNQRLGE